MAHTMQEDQEIEQSDNIDQVFAFYQENPEAPVLIAQADPPVTTTIQADDPTIPTDTEDPDYSFWSALWLWIKSHWAESILGVLAIIEVIVNLTPTDKDNSWFAWLKGLIQKILPNRSSSGGVHP